MNKLLRTVKRHRTANKLIKQGNVTVFRKTTYGYKGDGTVSHVLVQDRVFEVFEGTFYNYQLSLRENQKAELYNSKPETLKP